MLSSPPPQDYEFKDVLVHHAKKYTLLEVHFVAWKWRKTVPGMMTAGVGIGRKMKELCYEIIDEASYW